MLLPTNRIPNLNNANSAATLFGGAVGGSKITGQYGSEKYGDLVKTKDTAGKKTAFDYVNTATAVAEGITNAIGIRSPYYTIGEIPGNEGNFGSWLDSSLGTTNSTWLRAITTWGNTKQDGVIVDCLGQMDGTWSTEFTQNPVFYGTNTATDSRVRKPSTLTAEVYISNYLSDNIINGLISSIEKSILGTSVLSNALLYNGNTRAQQGLYKLIWLMENGMPFTVYTPHGIYESMLIKDIKVSTDDKSMEMLNATLTFEEIIMTRPYWSGDTTDDIPARKVLDASKDSKIQAWSTLRNTTSINKGL